MNEDITFCAAAECKNAETCARARKTSKQIASYADFGGKEDCEYYIQAVREKEVEK